MSFDEMITYTTKGNNNAVLTVGIIENGKSSYTVYGRNGKILPQDVRIYEIGSQTKAYTTALLSKAIEQGKINLDNSIDQYLDLPKKDYYPTIRRLVTHTSGYKEYYFERQMVSNFFHQRNDFYGITSENLIYRIGKIDLVDKNYDFKYSNFGIVTVEVRKK